MITHEQRERIDQIKQKVWRKVGDVGSCVLGYEMYVNGIKLMPQPFMGSITNDHFYDEVKEYLLDEGISNNQIDIDYGRMD